MEATVAPAPPSDEPNKMDCTDLNTEAHDAVRDLQDARSAIQRTEWRRAEKALAEARARIRRLQRHTAAALMA